MFAIFRQPDHADISEQKEPVAERPTEMEMRAAIIQNCTLERKEEEEEEKKNKKNKKLFRVRCLCSRFIQST